MIVVYVFNIKNVTKTIVLIAFCTTFAVETEIKER